MLSLVSEARLFSDLLITWACEDPRSLDFPMHGRVSGTLMASMRQFCPSTLSCRGSAPLVRRNSAVSRHPSMQA
jgi:hypothetical protein